MFSESSDGEYRVKINHGGRIAGGLALILGLFAFAGQSAAQRPAQSPRTGETAPVAPPAADAAPAYADFADLADSAPIIATVKLYGQVRVPPERSGNLRPGWARYYVEAKTVALMVGTRPIGATVAYLVDLPVDARGKLLAPAAKLAFIFARPVPDAPAQLQLVAPDAQVAVTPAREARLRQVLADLAAPDAPPRITAVRDALHVPGTLAGAGETQISLLTDGGGPASISVVRLPGQPPRWSASFGEIFDEAGKPPPRDTLTWYRLACFLPPTLPMAANVSDGPTEREQAEADYQLVLRDLGPCNRTRH